MKLKIIGYVFLGIFVPLALFGLFSNPDNHIFILYSIPLGVVGNVCLLLAKLRGTLNYENI